MTFQAQPKAAESVQKVDVTTEGQQVDAEATQVDATTLKVKHTGEASGEGEDEAQSQGENHSQEMIKEAMKELNKKASSVEAEFGIHEKTNRITIKMVDKKTKEVIKELPPEKMLDVIAKVWEMAGIIVDEKR